jgi:hypothetical protein
LLAFAVQLEFLLIPGAFPWDLAAFAVLFVPAADGGYTLLFEETCPACRRQKGVISRLDWLRRLRWAPLCPPPLPTEGLAPSPAPGAGRGLYLITPSGKVRQGFQALRLLPLLLPGPLFLFLAALRFGVPRIRFLAPVPAGDVLFLVVLILAALWLPGVSGLAARVVSPWSGRVFYRPPGPTRKGGAGAPCPLHRLLVQ